jgi:putative nicotinate phosphoribosyltransferase
MRWVSLFLILLSLLPVAAHAGGNQKVWMMQINPIVGDIEYNTKLIEDQYRQAVASGADVVMTPEMAVFGYPARDILRNREMLKRVNAAMEHLRKLTETLRTPEGKSVMLVVGHPGKTPDDIKGKELQNRTTVFDNGKVVEEHNKRLLPNYDIYDEERYFKAGTETHSFEKNGVVYAILNCEEGWAKDKMFGREIYEKDPVDDIKKLSDKAHAQGKKFIVLDTSASPWNAGKPVVREDIHEDVVKRTGVDGLLYTNQFGGTDSIVSDGKSFVLGKDGKNLGRLAGFKEAHGVVEVPTGSAPIRLANKEAFSTAHTPADQDLHDAMVMGIRDYFVKNKMKTAVIGLSGGKDSAVAAQLLVEALGSKNVIGISMPSSISSSDSKSEAEELAQSLGIRYMVKPVSEQHHLDRKLHDIVPGSLADQNVQARERGNQLMIVSNENPGSIVVGTGNKAEYFRGFASIYGDVFPFSPLLDLKVSQVRAVGWYGNKSGVQVATGKKVSDGKGGFYFDYDGRSEVRKNTIPANSLTKPPSAELVPGQIDEDNLPPYDVMDAMVEDIVVKDMGPNEFLDKWTKPENWGADKAKMSLWPRERLIKDMLQGHQISEIKRMLAMGIRVSPRAFGPGRTEIITKNYWTKGLNGEFENLANDPIDPKLPEPSERTLNAAAIVEKIIPVFHSSDMYIPAAVLHDNAWKIIPKDLRIKLGDLTQKDLLAALNELSVKRPDLKIDQGIVENYLKIQQMYKLKHDEELHFDDHGNVPGLSPKTLEQLVANFPPPPARTKDPNARSQEKKRDGEFDYVQHRAEMRSATKITNNDLYNFKVGADYWGNGLEGKYEVTASLYSRGHANRPYIVTYGQDQVLDVLKNLKFTEEEIQFLKNDPQFSRVPAGYWDYLRDFKFTGSIRGVKAGTVVYANEPVMQITASPVQTQIVETIIIPWMNKMSNWTTKAERITRAAGGRAVVEGGTRRGNDGFFSAIASVAGGSVGTSNAETAMTYDVPAFGSQNHFSIMMFDKESTAQSAFLRFFPTSTLLSDTNGPETSVRQAILSYGSELGAIRLDSTLPGKSKAETAHWARNLLNKLGYHNTKVIYSDGINEHELVGELGKDVPIDSFLVGTEQAAPSDANGLNFVYKVTEVKNKETGEVFDPMKNAEGKASLPGRHDLYRTVNEDGTTGKGYIAEQGESGPAGAKNLTVDLMINGKDVSKRDSIAEQQKYIKEQVSKLPKEQLDLKAKGISDYYTTSTKLVDRKNAAVARTSGARAPEMVMVFTGSFSPATASHIQMIKGVKELYAREYPNMKIVIVPSGDDNANGKTHQFTSKQRVEILKRKLGGEKAMEEAGITIDQSEIQGKSKYTVDTLSAIGKKYGVDGKKVQLSLVLGGDIVSGDNPKNLVANWKNADQIFDRYNVIFTPRNEGGNKIPVDHSTGKAEFIKYLPKSVQEQYSSAGALKAVNSNTGTFVQMVSVGVGNDSSTKLRESYKAVDTVYLNASEAGSGSTSATMRQIALNDPKGKAIATTQDNELQHRIPSGGEYNYDSAVDLHRDPNVELIFEKGHAENVASNPHFKQVMDSIAPQRYVLWGECGTACVDRNLNTLFDGANKGEKPKVVVISDNAKGVNPKWKSKGVEVMSSADYVKKYRPELTSLVHASAFGDCFSGKIRGAIGE